MIPHKIGNIITFKKQSVRVRKNMKWGFYLYPICQSQNFSELDDTSFSHEMR